METRTKAFSGKKKLILPLKNKGDYNKQSRKHIKSDLSLKASYSSSALSSLSYLDYINSSSKGVL